MKWKAPGLVWLGCLLISLLSPIAARGAPVTTKQAALALIIGPIVNPSTVTQLEIFATPSPLPAGTAIGTIAGPGSGGPSVLLTNTAEPEWLLFADLQAGARFAHPVKIILVRASDGKTTVFDATWWPTVDGRDKWISRADRDGSGDRVFSRHMRPAARGGSGGAPSGGSTSASQGSGDVPSYCPAIRMKWALMISAVDDAAVDPSETDNLALLLHSKGYVTQQLKPNSLSNGWATFTSEMDKIRQQILASRGRGYCNEFFLVWSGHGTDRGEVLVVDAHGNREFKSMRDIVDEVEKTTNQIEGMQIRVIIDTCFSGQSLSMFQIAMPQDPNEKSIRQIIRDVLAIAAAGSSEAAWGSSPLWNSFTVDVTKCIQAKGKVDFGSLFDCAKNKSTVQSPEARHWWNNGA
jgi:hypothetical protein